MSDLEKNEPKIEQVQLEEEDEEGEEEDEEENEDGSTKKKPTKKKKKKKSQKEYKELKSTTLICVPPTCKFLSSSFILFNISPAIAIII